jgi:FkbM family methyltransferase
MNIKTSLKDFVRNLKFRLIASDSGLYTAWYKYLYRPKEGSLSAFLDAFSRRNPGLTVIQVGANDGYHHDPLIKFIKRDRWKGLLLEPQKYVYDTFLSKLHRKAGRIQACHCALDYEAGERTMYKIAFSNARWASGLTSFDKSVLEEVIASGHVARKAAKEGIALPENKADYIAEEKVETLPPQKLLERHHIEQVDLLMIDTEGYDYEILKMFDIPVLQARVVIYEDQHLSTETQNEAISLLTTAGYTCKSMEGNTLAILSADQDADLL